MKRCITCKINKKNSEFYAHPSTKDNLQPYCKDCLGVRSVINQFKRKYDLTLDQKDEMIRLQNNRCAICENEFVLARDTHVDHCHVTNKVRQILCAHCNRGIGCFNDSPKLLEKAKYYVEYHAKQIAATSLPTGTNSQSNPSEEHGAVPTTGTREDSYDLDHYQRAVCGEDADYRAQTRGGDSVGYRMQKVEPSSPVTRIEDYGQPEPEIVRLEFGRRYLSDKP